MIRINCVTYFFICVSCTASFIIQENLTELSILHINDFHARYEETNIDSGLCKNKNCIGGFSRMYARIMKVFDKNPNLILLNAGDSFEGTLWYNVHKWNVTQYFLNKLPIDASTLGNHEFDDKIDGLVPFLRHLNAPVVVANIDATEEPVVKNLLNKSVIIERRGIKIGIIGVILSTTDELVNVGNIILLKELDSVNAEAARLVKEEGVFTNIVLSHCGYDAEKEIARKSSSKISLIVGGHSHSFLYTGEPVPGPDQPVGPYPTVVKNSEGKTVLIVQASSYSKYLGNLTISFNMNGEPVGWVGNSIFLDSTLSQDEEINEELLLWKQEVDRQGNKVIGSTLVRLKQSSCLTAECLMGNVITDAMVFAYTDSPVAESWTNGPIAIMHAKGLRSDIDVGNITYNDIVTAQPFANTIDIGEVTGKHLKEILESSVSTDNINLLQVSGMQVVYNLTKVEGSRVTCLKLRCRKCNAPVYENFDENKTYPIILPSFLANGGFGFSLIKTYLRNRQLGELDLSVFVRYIHRKSPIFQKIEGRIHVSR
ncbi:apyrase-like isoform X2 [Zophobas morio]|uniref:apyrase-like isoform X2 n=1 Tax=Zophobas morio TaxID=2755281 RepID=UPI00308328AE